jgi:hypothetical protein
VAAFTLAFYELSDREQISVLLAVMGAIGAGVFAAFCWMVKFAIHREVARMDKFLRDREQFEEDQDRFREWVRGIFYIYGMLPQPRDPNDLN